jgi:hypothetical protein
MPSSLSLPGPRARDRKAFRCSVKGCSKTLHGLSRYCGRHHTALQRYGHPTQTRILKCELAPYSKGLRRIIQANPEHPALTIIFRELDALLDRASVIAERHPYPSRWDRDGRQWVELARLARAGVSGVDVFTACASLHFLARDRPSRLEPYTNAFDFALARHTLNLAARVRLPGWAERKGFTGWVPSKETARLSSRVLKRLGRHLATSLIAVFVTLEPVFDRLS